MITVFYPAGAYGSTIEYCIRRFSSDFDTIHSEILPDGSMHGFVKECHILSGEIPNDINNAKIITPTYPNLLMDSVSAVSALKTTAWIDHSQVIFITVQSLDSLLRTNLNSYYKIKKEHSIDYGANKFSEWNSNYTNVNDLQIWERREAISLVNDDLGILNSVELVHPDWLVIQADDIVFNLQPTILKIFEYLSLSLVDDGFDCFYKDWFNKQQYILEKCQLIYDIVGNTINNHCFTWEPLDLMLEACIQKKFREHGYELKCHNLNEFPTDSTTLRSLFV